MKRPCSALVLLASSALATGALMLGTPAFAETAADAADAASDATEIVVTGTLRSQRLQDAPIAVNLVPAQTINEIGFKQPSDLQFLSTSVQISLQGANAIFIRGEGTASQVAQEQSVGLVIDGVVQGFVDDVGGDTSDLDHIEVYRGPQGTQFGKNSSAGVVSISTKNPQFDAFTVDGNFTYGQYDDTSDTIAVNVPVTDKFAGRLVLGYQNRDGVFPNPYLTEKDGSRTQHSMRLKLLDNPTDDLSLLFTGDVRYTQEKPNFAQAWAFCGPAGPTTPYVNVYGTHNLPPCNGAVTVPGFVASPTNTEVVEFDNAFRHTIAGGGSLQAVQAIDDFTLTSITAYRFMLRHFVGPGGSGTFNQTGLNNQYEGVQFSEELRIASPEDQPLTYVGGIFLYDRDTTVNSLRSGPFYGQAFFQDPNTPYGSSVLLSQQGGRIHEHNIDKSYAAFLDGSYHITDQLQINAGVRGTHDDVTATSYTSLEPGIYPQVAGGKPFPNEGLTIHGTGATYHIGPQYFITPDIQVYGTYSHGYKGPMIDPTVAPINPIKPEEVDLFEAGIKSSWFDHRLTANLTGFHQSFKDLQVTVFNFNVVPNAIQLGNAAGATSEGFELETSFKPIEDLKFTANMTYDDAYYTDFSVQCWPGAEPIKQATSGANGCFVHPGNTSASSNAANTPMINASKWTYNVSATYTYHFGNEWLADVTGAYQWRSSWLSSPMDPNIVNPGYGVLALNAGITSPGGKYRFGMFARNALGTFFRAGTQQNSGGWTIVENPESARTIGFSLDAHY